MPEIDAGAPVSAALVYERGGAWLEYRTLRQPCPICGKTDRCKQSPDGAVAMCFRESAGSFKATAGAVAWLHRLQNLTPSPFPLREGVRAGMLAPPSRIGRGVGGVGSARPMLAPVAVRDAAIRVLLPLLRQSVRDVTDLERRGFYGDAARGLPPVSDERIREYLTLPGDSHERTRLLAEVRKQVDSAHLAGLGFAHLLQNGQLAFSGVPHGKDAPDVQIYPVVNANGDYLALRTEIPTNEGKSKRWMSGGMGASVGSPAHIAMPVVAPVWAEAGYSQKSTVIITEGEKKGDLVAAWLGYVTVCVPGVSNFNAAQVLDVVLNQLGVLGVKAQHVILAYDADLHRNSAVRSQLANLATQATAAGLDVQLLTWPGDAGKGIDDYLWAVGETTSSDLRLMPFVRAIEEGDTLPVAPLRGFVRLSEATAKAVQQASESQPTMSLFEAQLHNATLVSETIGRYLASGGTDRRLVVNAGTTGIGKTYATMRVLADHLAAGTPGRIAVLVDTKEQLAAWVAPGSPLAPYHATGQVALRKGRQAPPLTVLGEAITEDHECRNMPKAAAAGARHHPTAPTVCAGCPLGKTNASGWNCRENGYLAAVKKAQNGQIVIATKDAILNNSQEVGGFDVLIVDEGIREENIVERRTLTADDLAVWRNRLAGVAATAPNRSLYDAFETLYRLMALALADVAAGQYAHMRDERTAAYGLAPVLAQVAAAAGHDFAALLADAHRLRLPKKGQTESYEWERLDVTGLWDKTHSDYDHTVWPKRATKALLDTLAEEAGRDVGANFRALIVPTTGGGACIELRQPKANVVAALSGAQASGLGYSDTENLRACPGLPPSVIILDATPNIELLRLATGQEPEVLRLPVAQALDVTQVYDSLFKGAELLKQPQQVARLVAAWEHAIYEAAARNVVIFTEKPLNPAATSTQADAHVRLLAFQNAMAAQGVRVRFSHFGLDNRASNAYADADLLILVGHPQAPATTHARLIATLRHGTIAQSQPCDTDRVLRRYETQDMAQAAARWRPVDADPQIAALSYNSYAAQVLQTIGRGRASRRPADAPLRVLLFCAEPIAGLPVARLARLSELAHMPAISERQRAALDAGRDARNDALHTDAVRKIEAALDTLIAQFPASIAKMTVRAVAECAGVNRDTAATIIKAMAAQSDADTGLLLDIYRSPDPARVLAPPVRGEQMALIALPAPILPRKLGKSALRKAKRRANRPD